MIFTEAPTVEGFEKFVNLHERHDSVGEAGSPMHCPVAHYLQSLIEDAVVVEVEGGFALVEGERHDLPAEFESIVEHVDDSYDTNEPVFPLTLLSIIRGVA